MILERVIEAVYLVIIAMALMLVFLAARNALGSDNFVQMIERREGMAPGQTKVLPECSCTIRYLGTTVRGRNYDVHIRRLD